MDNPIMDPSPPQAALEQDSRFPSSEWTGFFLQRHLPGRQWMDLHLTFHKGEIRGDGRDSTTASDRDGRQTGAAGATIVTTLGGRLMAAAPARPRQMEGERPRREG